MARIMDFVHDDSGSHISKSAKVSAKPDEDEDDDLLSDVKEGPEEGPEEEPYEGDDAEPEPEPDEPEEDAEEEEPEEKPEPKAAKRKSDPLKAEMDRLVAESRRAAQLEARLLEQERRAQIADLNSIKATAALKSHQFEALKRELDEAIELGEVSRQSELRDKYHDARTELQQFGAYIQRQEQQLQQQVQQQPAPVAPNPPPNPRAVAWTKKQKWWGVDKALTSVAFTIDDQLVEEGVNPYTDAYYRELSKRLAPYVPNENRRRQAVAGVNTRSAPPRSGRKIKLDADQLDTARRLNVPPEEYAKYVDY